MSSVDILMSIQKTFFFFMCCAFVAHKNINRYLEPHPNIVSLEDLLVNRQHDELYIVMELLDCDLHYVINKSNQPLDDVHHRYFMFQILKGVKASG